MASFFGMGKSTFKKKKVKGGEIAPDFTLRSLKAGNMKNYVRLPESEDLNEWLAIHVNDFFHLTTMLYSCINHACTAETCPIMSAGPGYEYMWGEGKKKTGSQSAPEYCELLFVWVESQLEDPAIFPSKIGDPFPKNFFQICKTIFKRLFRVFAHMYYSHVPQLQELEMEAHVNTTLIHFYCFCLEFQLVESKELEALSAVYERLVEADR